jgi:hypothetical protein
MKVDTTPLWGLRISLPRPCPTCGSATAVIVAGVGPHAASLRCDSCGLHRGWLPRAQAEALAARKLEAAT